MLSCHLGGAYSGNAGLESIRKRELQAAENKGIGLRCPQSLAQLTGASLSPNTFSSARGTLEKKNPWIRAGCVSLQIIDLLWAQSSIQLKIHHSAPQLI